MCGFPFQMDTRGLSVRPCNCYNIGYHFHATSGIELLPYNCLINYIGVNISDETCLRSSH